MNNINFNTGVWALLPEFKSNLINGAVPSFSRYDATNGDIQIVSVAGVITKNCGMTLKELKEFGLCDLDIFSKQLRQAAENPNVDTIVLAFDTPGGETTGVYEAGKLIEEIGNQKNIIGYTSDMAASAGYWLFAKCNEGYCSPSSRLGHIGATCERIDLTEQLTNCGVKIDHISSSPRKNWGDPSTKTSAEEREWRITVVQQLAEQFKTEVLSNRVIEANYLDAVVLNGTEAVSANLADGNLNSLEELVRVIQETKPIQF